MNLTQSHPPLGVVASSSVVVDAAGRLVWSTATLAAMFVVSAAAPVVLARFGALTDESYSGTTQPIVEVNLTGDGRARTTTRFTHSGVGARLRYVSHEAGEADGGAWISIVQSDALSGLRVTTTFTASASLCAAQVVTTVVNDGDRPAILEVVTSLGLGCVVYGGESTRDLIVYTGSGEQLAENRWSSRPLWSQTCLADFNSTLHKQPGRGAVEAVSTSTWSTARDLPTGVLENATTGRSLAWQIEHNGGWRWEIDNGHEDGDSVSILLMGPEDLDHQWSEELAPGAAFTSVPVSIAVSSEGFTGAVAELTRHRRWLRRDRKADLGSVLVFNDYMNTINGDPTTARLLPLIESAAAAGAEVFCIDAGWYDDTDLGDWWPSVGDWIPSERRFPNGGLARVVAAIRDTGMKVGLWLEPEVIGVRSSLARLLPDAAFLQRHGRRVTEDRRHFLDLRHPAARAHLDATFDRLITRFGVDFFKLDYNVTPGPGTDVEAFSAGAGLLGHNRAHLAWFEQLRRRYPEVIFENCSSGAMRADFAMLQAFDLQSTSDQQDYTLYPPIAAGAPLQMLPEQAGNWAYPQEWMTEEQIAFTMATGLSGRLYASGFLNLMDDRQLALVSDAYAVFKATRDHIAQSTPEWPNGLPQWYGDSIALSLSTPQHTLLYVWHRGDATGQIHLELGDGVVATDLHEIYPRTLRTWDVADGPLNTVVLTPGIDGPTARVYTITRR